MSTQTKSKVYRVRFLPDHVDRLKARDILGRHIEGVDEQDVQVFSLARDVHGTKTATVAFDKTPPGLQAHPSMEVEVSALRQPLIIDEEFEGVTPLNDVPKDEHTHE